MEDGRKVPGEEGPQVLPRFWLTQLMLRPDVRWEQHH